MINLSAPDLTRHPPRSPRVQLGGFIHLPRLLDKARATAAGTNGEYNYDCPLDQHFFVFTGIKAKALLAEVRKGRSDTQMLGWVRVHTKVLPSEVAAWDTWMRGHAPGRAAGHEWFAGVTKTVAPGRDDI
ncbi:MAG TPA: DUF5069 domain-containing protein, partial [Opitutaceae bacterium]|nr:DUF5069 domain-containing protein [Opitutaceae bacterium]